MIAPRAPWTAPARGGESGLARMLVTGGAGMIGSNLVRRLVAFGHEVSVVDDLSRGRPEQLRDESGAPLIDLDRHFHRHDLKVPHIADDLVAEADFVFHLADVVGGIDYVFRHEGAVFHENVLINTNVLASARRARLAGFVYVGTACSFPARLQTGVDAPPLKEEDQYPAGPESAYGWSKLIGEYETLLFEKETKTPAAVLVLHNVYGTPCDYGDRSQVIPALVRRAVLWPREPFVVWGDGRQGRAFVHVDDVVDALVAAVDRGLGRGVIQIGPDVCTSVRELAETVVAVSGKSIEIRFDPTRPVGDRGRRADYSKARRLLGWEPRVGLREGIERLYRWMEPRLA